MLARTKEICLKNGEAQDLTAEAGEDGELAACPGSAGGMQCVPLALPSCASAFGEFWSIVGLLTSEKTAEPLAAEHVVGDNKPE